MPEIWQVVLFPSNYHTQKHRKLSKIRWKQTIPFAFNCTSLITDVAGLMSINTRFNTQKRQHPHVERWSSSLYKWLLLDRTSTSTPHLGSRVCSRVAAVHAFSSHLSPGQKLVKTGYEKLYTKCWQTQDPTCKQINVRAYTVTYAAPTPKPSDSRAGKGCKVFSLRLFWHHIH